MSGEVVAIHVRPRPGAPTTRLAQATASPGVGLTGDHAHASAVTRGKPLDAGAEVTLIEFEALEAIERESNITLEMSESRRNITTRGVALNHCVNREFRIGQVILRGVKLCEPCSHLESLTRKGVCAALVHRGGLWASIVRGGVIREGDAIST